MKTVSCNLCGADLKSYYGKRPVAVPLVLGHEFLSIIVENPNGEEFTTDYNNQMIYKGDRVIFYIIHFCSTCYYCNNGLPQKCINQQKIGHSVFSVLPMGGLSSFNVFDKHIPIFRIPNKVSDFFAGTLTCSFTTAYTALSTLKLGFSREFVVVGSGLLAVFLCLILKEKKATTITVVINDIAKASVFSKAEVHEIILLEGALSRKTMKYDCLIDAAGDSTLIERAITDLTDFGEIVLLGSTHPVNDIKINPEMLVRKCISIHSVHNYTPKDLSEALSLMEKMYAKIAFVENYCADFQFSNVKEAFQYAKQFNPLRCKINFAM